MQIFFRVQKLLAACHLHKSLLKAEPCKFILQILAIKPLRNNIEHCKTTEFSIHLCFEGISRQGATCSFKGNAANLI